MLNLNAVVSDIFKTPVLPALECSKHLSAFVLEVLLGFAAGARERMVKAGKCSSFHWVG